MQSLLNNNNIKHHDQSSYATSYSGHLYLWFPTKQPQLSQLDSDATNLQSKAKFTCCGYQEKDLCPSVESSYHHEQNFPFQTGLLEACKKKADLPYCVPDYIDLQVQMERHNRPSDCIASYPFGGSYSGKTTPVYGPNHAVYPPAIEIAAARAVLPLGCTESMVPIYVNAKQYHAILRRRQTRARLEAQNKNMKSRKPYLHHSRHLHALKRVRGSGGRFLNTKNGQKSKPQQRSESASWVAATASDSTEVSCTFNNGGIFQSANLGVSVNSLMGAAERYAPI